MALKTSHEGLLKYKTRLVVQGHTDKEKNILFQISTTLRQWSVRVILSVAATLGPSVWSQDISQAHLQRAKN